MKPSIADYKVNAPNLAAPAARAMEFLLYLLDTCEYERDYEVDYDHRYSRSDLGLVSILDDGGIDVGLEFETIEQLREDLYYQARHSGGKYYSPTNLIVIAHKLFDKAYKDVYGQAWS